MTTPNCDFLHYLGKRIGKTRKQLGLSQAELAELADLSVSYISKIERGIVNFSAETLSKIATALNTSSSRLLNEVCAESLSPLRRDIEKALNGYSSDELDNIIQIINIINKIKKA